MSLLNVTKDEVTMESTILSVSDDEEELEETKEITAETLIEDIVDEFEHRFLAPRREERRRREEEDDEEDTKRSELYIHRRHTINQRDDKELLDMVERFRPKSKKRRNSSLGNTKSLGRLLIRYAKRKRPKQRVILRDHTPTKRLLRIPLRLSPPSITTPMKQTTTTTLVKKENKQIKKPCPPPPLPAPRRLTEIEYEEQNPTPIIYASQPAFRQLSSTGDRLAMVLIAFELERDLRERAEMNLVSQENKRHAKVAARIADLATKLQEERSKREVAEGKLLREREEEEEEEGEEMEEEEEDNNLSRSLFRESLRSRGRTLSEEYGHISRRADELEESISKTFSIARNLTKQNEIDLKDHKSFLQQIRPPRQRRDDMIPDQEEEDDEDDDPTRTLAIRELHALKAMIDEVDSLTDIYENFDRTVASSSNGHHHDHVPLKSSFSPRRNVRRRKKRRPRSKKSLSSSLNSSLYDSMNSTNLSDGSLMRVKAYDSHGNLVASVRNSRRFDSKYDDSDDN